MASSRAYVSIAIAAAAVLGSGLRWSSPASGQEMAGGQLRKCVIVSPQVTLPASIQEPAATQVKAWVVETLSEALRSDPSLVLTSNAAAAQFAVHTKLARAGHFTASGNQMAGAAVYVRLLDVASGVELMGERFVGKAPAAGDMPDALARIREPATSTTPLIVALKQALTAAGTAVTEQLRPRLWESRVSQVTVAGPAAGARSRKLYMVHLPVGANVGLQAGDWIQFSRYEPLVQGSDGTTASRSLLPPIGSLKIVSVGPSAATARTELPISPSDQPRVQDVIRRGKALKGRWMGSWQTVPPGDRAFGKISRQIQDEMDAEIQNYQRMQLKGATNLLKCTGTVERISGPQRLIKVTATIIDKRPGGGVHTDQMEGLIQNLADTAHQLWIKLKSKLQPSIAHGPTGESGGLTPESSSAASFDPGLLPAVGGVASFRFHHERSDFHLQIALDRAAGAVYTIGEPMKVTIKSPDTDCYVQIWNITDHGTHSYQVYPRQPQPRNDPLPKGNDPVRNDPDQGKLAQGEALTWPPRGAFIASPPVGEDYMVVVAVRGEKGRRLYGYLAGLMQKQYPPLYEADRLDAKLPPTMATNEPNHPSRSVLYEELDGQERANDAHSKGVSSEDDPVEGWQDQSLWASNVTWWRTKTVSPDDRAITQLPWLPEN